MNLITVFKTRNYGKRFFFLLLSGESGIFVGKINPKRVLNDFSGYVDRKASEQKILRDVFRKGDRVFNSGN